LAENRNVLPGQHAYSHVNALSSAMQSYLTDGNEMHLRAAKNGFRFVLEQSFATGGWGPQEAFTKPGTDELANSLHSTHASFETPCGAYGQFKIVRYLMRVTGESVYGDSMEAVLYNTILGARPTRRDGVTFYYSDYNMDGQKGDYRDKWPCCSGTFPQLTADYGISSYYRGPDGIYVNLFLPSKLSWSQASTPVQLTQTTEYPRANTTVLAFRLSRPETFATYIRIPAWAGAKTTVRVNGKRAEEAVEPGKFLALKRTWKDGDRIEVEFEMPLRLESVAPESPNNVALMKGPLALFAVSDIPPRLTRQQLLGATPVASTSDDWTVESDGGRLTMRPFMAIMSEKYRLYNRVEAG
jgi:hypothetical protein